MKKPFRPTHDPNLDTFKIEYLLIGSFVAAMVFNYEYTFAEVNNSRIFALTLGLDFMVFYL